jgi:hypothetical protein
MAKRRRSCSAGAHNQLFGSTAVHHPTGSHGVAGFLRASGRGRASPTNCKRGAGEQPAASGRIRDPDRAPPR